MSEKSLLLRTFEYSRAPSTYLKTSYDFNPRIHSFKYELEVNLRGLRKDEPSPQL